MQRSDTEIYLTAMIHVLLLQYVILQNENLGVGGCWEIKIDARTLLSHHPNYVTDAKLRQPEVVLRIALAPLIVTVLLISMLIHLVRHHRFPRHPHISRVVELVKN